MEVSQIRTYVFTSLASRDIIEARFAGIEGTLQGPYSGGKLALFVPINDGSPEVKETPCMIR